MEESSSGKSLAAPLLPVVSGPVGSAEFS